MKILSHPLGSDQMFQLQSDFGVFLRKSAFFEGIGELIVLTDPQQKLRLGVQRLDLHSSFLGCGSERCEVHVSGYVLFSGRFESVRAH